MNNTATSSASIESANELSEHPSLHAKMVLKLLNSLKVGELEMVFPDGSVKEFRGQDTRIAPAQPAHRARIELHDFKTLSLAASRGDVGFGEAYMQGLWSSPNLTALLRLLIANRDAMHTLIYGRWWSMLADQIRHLLRSNRKKQARKNIAAHYDLGNDFYKIWLDPTMTYSSALFDTTGRWGAEVNLQEGQRQKIDRALAEIGADRFTENSTVLEIGCGWGGLADRLLETSRARYKGLTLSSEQQRWAGQTLSRHAPKRYDVALQDYRDEMQQYDGIVSIEMFEAVGERYWAAYFKAIAKCLKHNGRALVQTITIDERLFERYRRGTDFIQQYIFPGGMLPSPQAFAAHAHQHGLEIETAFRFGQDYARTLAEWAKTFDARRSMVDQLGFDSQFQRMWRFYLSYCEAGFAEGNLDVMQFTLRHRQAR